MHRLAWPLRFVAIILAGALLTTGVVLAVAPRLWQVANAHEELPVQLPEFQPLSQRTLVYDIADNVIAVYERENSQPINLAQVPVPVIDALLSVEDNEYYSHHGVNLRGFFRALLSNFASDAPTQGASTITQQVVKNEFLAGLPRDGRYKALQAHYATMLEKKLTKDQILERYINTVYFGNNAYGLQAAAEVYFGKDVGALTMVEGAFLAGLVRSPSGYDPIRNLEQSHRRFAQVVARLESVGLVTDVEGADLIENWPIPDRVRTIATLSTVPTYYTLALRDYLLTKSTILGATEQERATLLYRGGLRIHTTLDPVLQVQAEQARNILPNSNAGFDAAIIGLDTTNGAVRVMVGGRGLRTNEPGGEVNMSLVPRQTGSSIKAFILAAAYEAGAQTNDIINGTAPCAVPDEGNKVLVIKGGSIEIGPLNGRNTWLSTDCGFVRLSYSVGLHRIVDSVYRMAHSAYFYQGQSAKDHEPFIPIGATATGNNALSPMDMAAGMQTITNQGLHHDPYFVEYIQRPDGTRFYSHADPGVQVLDPNAANETVQSLKGVIRSGTGARNLRNFSHPAAGKTGTQFENTNAWFVGGTPQITTAVWVGDPNGYTPMNRIPEFQAEMGRNGKVQGADYPARIWGAFMESALYGQPMLDWPAPAANARKAARLYWPGEECLAKLVSGTLPPTGPAATATTSSTEPPSTLPDETPPPETTAPRAVVQQIPSGTNVPLDVLDPHAPMPSIDTRTYVYPCAFPPADVVVQKKGK
ncbi:MAG TPA: transglycosylase domain-containing protein [Ilumatobacteraceae bacterium]|nr:transglycosylase domain-containing protein [Ilumatobacteraceae bacterium]HRB02977.1 transglycosylase domain-containing protein [Ilumatobacteraceae bacterium]